MGMTLQDILFLWHFPITGKVVLIDSCANNNNVFVRMFGQEPPKKLEVKFMAEIAIARCTFQTMKQWKIVVLMIIIWCFIMPSHDGNHISSSYVELWRILILCQLTLGEPRFFCSSLPG